MAAPPPPQHGWVRVNVGGCRFETTLETLRRVPGSMLERMFDPANPAKRVDADGCYTIDRDPVTFDAILNGLRRGLEPRQPPSVSDEEWRADLDFYGLLPEPADAERDTKRRRLIEDARQRMERETRTIYDFVFKRMSNLRETRLKAFVPVTREPLDPEKLSADECAIDWGQCLTRKNYRDALAHMGLNVTVLCQSEKVSYKKASKLEFVHAMIDAERYPPEKSYAMIDMLVAHFELVRGR